MRSLRTQGFVQTIIFHVLTLIKMRENHLGKSMTYDVPDEVTVISRRLVRHLVPNPGISRILFVFLSNRM